MCYISVPCRPLLLQAAGKVVPQCEKAAVGMYGCMFVRLCIYNVWLCVGHNWRVLEGIGYCRRSNDTLPGGRSMSACFDVELQLDHSPITPIVYMFTYVWQHARVGVLHRLALR